VILSHFPRIKYYRSPLTGIVNVYMTPYFYFVWHQSGICRERRGTCPSHWISWL